MGKEPELWEYGCSSSPQHSFIPHSHHTLTLIPSRKGINNLQPKSSTSEHSEENSRESLPPETQTLFPLTAHPSPHWITLELRISSTTSRFSAFQRWQLPIHVLKPKTGGHLFLGTVLRASNCLRAKVKTTNFPHSILDFLYRGSFTSMSGETKTAGYFSPTVYN